jgi:hypothetical protein
MNVTYQIRKKLREFGFRSNLDQEIQTMGIQLTICQFIVVVLSIMSVVFLFLPIFKMQDMTFMLLLFGLSMLCLILGIWFWVKRGEICEHPEEVEDR